MRDKYQTEIEKRIESFDPKYAFSAIDFSDMAGTDPINKVLSFEDKAECIIRDNELVIRPARIDSNGEFAEEILSDLIKEGYSGQALLKEFKNRQAKVRPAVKKMLDDAHKMATGELESMSYDDVFGEEE